MQQQKSVLMPYGKSVRHFNMLSIMLAAFFLIAPVYATETQKMVAFGDSLTAGYGLSQAHAFPVQLERALRDEGLAIKVENAGVSGDTSTGGLQRLDWALANGADFVLLELGANDALRGIDPSITRRNLDAIITKIRAKNIPIFFTGMRAPPNMGPVYQQEFDEIFPELAKKHNLAFYPFFLEGVAAMADLNQSDAIHPNSDGVAIIVKKMVPHLVSFIKNK